MNINFFSTQIQIKVEESSSTPPPVDQEEKEEGILSDGFYAVPFAVCESKHDN
jgi:hypothetical protein